MKYHSWYWNELSVKVTPAFQTWRIEKLGGYHLVTPVYAEDHGHHPALFFVLGHQGRLLHPKDPADLIELKLVCILLAHLRPVCNHPDKSFLTHPLLDELVPVEAGEGLG